MRVDLRGGDIQGIETVADERLIIQILRNFSKGPGTLSEAGAKEVVSHTPVGACVEGERVNHRSASRNSGVAGHQREPLVELPANVPGHEHRGRPQGRLDHEAISQLLVEDVAAQNKHRAIHSNIVASVDLVDIAQMVGESFVAVERIEVSDLRIVVER